MKVVIINGSAESGKDEFITFIQKRWVNRNIVNTSTIDPSKAALKTLGWDGKTKNKETRQAMVDLKQMSIRLFNGPFRYINELIDTFEKQFKTESSVYFVHCREPEEIEKFAIHYKKKCITLLVRSKRGKALENGADNVVENYDYDHIIENNKSLKELETEAISFAKNYLGV